LVNCNVHCVVIFVRYYLIYYIFKFVVPLDFVGFAWRLVNGVYNQCLPFCFESISIIITLIVLLNIKSILVLLQDCVLSSFVLDVDRYNNILLLVKFTEFYTVAVTCAMLWNNHKNFGKRRLNHSSVAVGICIFTFGGYWYNIDQKISIQILDTGKPIIVFTYSVYKMRYLQIILCEF